MSNVNLLKPNKENLNLFLFLGVIFFSLGLIDFCLNNFYEKNITIFLPSFISFFSPLIFGMIGLHFIRIEFTGIKFLDELIVCFPSSVLGVIEVKKFFPRFKTGS